MTELLWAAVALILLSVLILLGLGNNRIGGLRGSGFTSLDDLIEGGLFMLALCIVGAPLILLWMGGAAIWKKYHPPVVPPPLPVEGDDPVWGRNVTRKIVERAFLAVQEALTKRDPALAKPFISEYVFYDLQAECERLSAKLPINPRGPVQLDEIEVLNERIDDFKISSGRHAIHYYLDAAVRGTKGSLTSEETNRQSTVSHTDVQKFETKLQFARGPGNDGHWCLVGYPELPKSKAHRKALAG